MTLDARPAEVIGMVIRQSRVMAGTGLMAGLLAAFGLTRLMASILYDVEPSDPGTFALTALALCTTGLAACWLPALKAANGAPL